MASEFKCKYEKTDKYFKSFLNMFSDIGIEFSNAYVIDGRISKEKAQELIMTADVIWLSGGMTISEYKYFKEYGLITPLQNCDAVIIGMSAGAINMAKTAIAASSVTDGDKVIYEGLGVVDISVEPHFNDRGASDTLLDISQKYTIYGLCDDAAIICNNNQYEVIGDVYKIYKGEVKKIDKI